MCLSESLELAMPPFATAQAVQNQTSCELLKINVWTTELSAMPHVI